MNDRIRYLVLRCVSFSLVLITCVMGNSIHAQQSPSIAGQPVIAIGSFSGFDALARDVELISTLAGKPGLKDLFAGFSSMATGGSGTEGLRLTEPWGAIVYGDDFNFAGFIPSHDPTAVLDSLRAVADGNLSEVRSNVYRWEQNGQTVFVTTRDKFVWIARDEDQFDSYPANPRETLGDLPLQFDVAVRLHVQTLPKSIRHMWFTGFESNYNRITSQLASQGTRRPQAPQFAGLRRAIDELDTLTIGWNLDETRAEAELEVAFSAVAGSKLSRAASKRRTQPSRFAGFALPDATFSANLTLALDAGEIEPAADWLNKLRRRTLKRMSLNPAYKNNEAQREMTKRVTSVIYDEAVAVVREGTVDFVGSVIGKPEQPQTNRQDRSFDVKFDRLTFIAATKVGDEKRVEALIRKFGEQSSSERTFQWNAFSHQGLRFHKFVIPAKDVQHDTFGDKMDLFVGFGPRSCYVAAGHDAQQSLIAAIDQSRALTRTRIAPFRLSISFTDCILASPVGGPFEQVQETWREITNDDKLHVSLVPLKNGGRVHLKAEKGVVAGFCRSIGLGFNAGLQPQ